MARATKASVVVLADEAKARVAEAPSTALASPFKRLGLQGLEGIAPVLVAALATEEPLLLIGPHGTAKSLLLTRVATALALEFRHYNASLLNFDDLVGFPLPGRDGRLEYVKTPAAVWGAGAVIFDEISRCRPDIQNKLFPIIHERKVQGIALETLRYRWAAMNPPGAPDSADEQDMYAGSLPLDPALADRFGFVLPLPSLDDLSPEARRLVIRSGLGTVGIDTDALDVPALVAGCRHHAEIATSLHGDWITAYTAALVVPLRQAGLAISGRRAAMLAANIATIHGARQTLGDDGAAADSALVALRHSLPQRAQGKSVDAGVVTSIHRQAVDAATQSRGDATLARILDEAHPVKRVGLALAALTQDSARVPRHTMSLLVADALASQDKQARWVLTQELLPAVVELDCVDAPTLELLAGPFTAQVSFEERPNLRHEVPRSRVAPFNALVTAMASLDASDPEQVALGNLGAALYAQDEGAAEPAALRHQRSALRDQLDVKSLHAL